MSCCRRSFVLYAAYRYGWDVKTVGLMLAPSASARWWCRALAIGPIVKPFGERNALLFGLAFGALGLFIYGAAPTGLWFCLGIPVNALWGVAGAATQALMTRRVAPEQQGQLQGATSSVQSVSQMVGPFLFTLIFAFFIGDSAPVKLPGAPFLLAGALVALALAIAARTLATGNEVGQSIGSARSACPISVTHDPAFRFEMAGLRHSGMTAYGRHFLTSGHSLASSGLAASSGAIVAISL